MNDLFRTSKNLLTRWPWSFTCSFIALRKWGNSLPPIIGKVFEQFELGSKSVYGFSLAHTGTRLRSAGQISFHGFLHSGGRMWLLCHLDVIKLLDLSFKMVNLRFLSNAGEVPRRLSEKMVRNSRSDFWWTPWSSMTSANFSMSSYEFSIFFPSSSSIAFFKWLSNIFLASESSDISMKSISSVSRNQRNTKMTSTKKRPKVSD